MKHSITFKKLILLFSAVVAPFFAFSFFLIYRNNTAAESKTFASIREKTQMVSETLAFTLKQIYHTAAEVSEQSNLRRLADTGFLMTPYETAHSILQLGEQQTSIKNANQYIENFIIYYKDSGKAYNSTGDGRTSFFEFEEKEYRQLQESYSASGFLTIYEGTLMEVIPPALGSGFLIRADLSDRALQDLMEGTFTEYEPYYIMEFFGGAYQLSNLNESQLQQLQDDFVSASKDDGPARLTLEGRQFYSFGETLPYGDGHIRYLFPREQLFAGTKIYRSLHLYFFLLILLCCCLFTWGSYSLIHKPIKALTEAFQGINRQDYSVRLLEKKNSDFCHLYKEFNYMAQELETLIEKDYKQQLLLNKAELKQLQAQINPHFLYNSFFLLRRMIQDELFDEARRMADTLGMYFQYITRNSKDQVMLRQEYHHAMLYCEIQQLRFEGRIQVETDPLPEQYAGILVPKLILQPILENAFNYGLQNKVDNGILRVSIKEAEVYLAFSIEDNGEELSDAQLNEIQNNLTTVSKRSSLQEMTGILNIQRRLIIYSDSSARLEASRSPLGGLCIRLFLPITPVPHKDR